MLYPNAPATGAAYLNVSPIIETLVFALLDAAARTFAKWVESDAASPIAVSASVTISEVVARSSPDAAARSMIPSIPDSISCVFHPAIAMYSIAWADSEALNFVFAPISFALSVSFCSSSPVAPEMADTFDISDSKLTPTFTAAAAAPPRAVDTALTAVATVFRPVFASFPILLKSFSIPDVSSPVSIITFPSANHLTILLAARLHLRPVPVPPPKLSISPYPVLFLYPVRNIPASPGRISFAPSINLLPTDPVSGTP